MVEAEPSRQLCSRCLNYNPVDFWVPNDIWEKVVPSRFRNNLFCLFCFTKMADERSVDWAKDIKLWPCSLATTKEGK